MKKLNQAQWDGQVNHIINTIGTTILSIAGFAGLLFFIPAGAREWISNWFTAEVVEETSNMLKYISTAIAGIVGAVTTWWSFIRSKKAPEKQITDAARMKIVKSLMK